MPRSARSIPARVERLRDRIEDWRQRRQRRTAMPPGLWTEATALARSEGAYRIARTLGLNFDGLKRRMAEATLEGAGAVVARGGFVELSGAQLVGAAPAPGTIVELSDSRTRLVVRLPREVTLDVAEVVSAFRRCGT